MKCKYLPEKVSPPMNLSINCIRLGCPFDDILRGAQDLRQIGPFVRANVVAPQASQHVPAIEVVDRTVAANCDVGVSRVH